MTADDAFKSYLEKIAHADLPWEVPVEVLRGAFTAGWVSCGSGRPPPAEPPTDELLQAFDAIDRMGAEASANIYAAWPIKKARGAAIAAINKALKKVKYSELLEAVTAYAAAVRTWRPEDMKYVPMCSTWMNQERWTDDRATWGRGGVAAVSQFSKTTK